MGIIDNNQDCDQAFNNNFNWEKDHLEQDEAVSYESHNQDCCLNQKTNINVNQSNEQIKYSTLTLSQNINFSLDNDKNNKKRK